MTVANAIRGRATDGRMRNGRFAPETMTRRMRPMKTTRTRNDWRRASGGSASGWASRRSWHPAELRPVHRRAGRCQELRPPTHVGLRELACGVGLLSERRPAGWAWARVAGDMMDIALLGSAMAGGAPRRDRVVGGHRGRPRRDRRRICTAPSSSAAGTEGRGPAAGSASGRSDVRKAITVNRPAGEVYRFWHDFRNLPRFMHHLESVQVTGDRRSHWKTKAPAGMPVEWDAEIVEDRPNERIAWRSVEGSQVDNAGSVRFVPAPGRTGHRGPRRVALQPAGRRGRRGDRLALRRVARPAGVRRPPRLQAGDRDRRGRRVRRDARPAGLLAAAGAAPGATPGRLARHVERPDPGRRDDQRGRGARPPIESERSKTLESQLLDRSKNHVQVERVPDPKILNSARRDRPDHLDGDLRLRPAPLQRLHADDAVRRHPRPRVHGRGRRGRAGGEEPQGRRPRRRPVPDRLRQLPAVRAADVLALRELQSQRLDGREDVRPRDRPASSATRT